MAGNSIGKEFVVTSFGESHGKHVGVIVDGCPAVSLEAAWYSLRLWRNYEGAALLLRKRQLVPAKTSAEPASRKMSPLKA